jgi:hypothetical protein
VAMGLTDDDKQWIADQSRQSEARLALLITNVKESLEEEIGQIGVRIDDVVLRLDRQGSYWQTGRRWSARMDDWAEKFDKALEVKDRQISELQDRLRRLEQK